MVSLNWPAEMLDDDGDGQAWMHPESNICLDFHGDPVKARLVVFSDGNHHMALQEALDQFQKQHPNCGHIFYVTTPPGPIVNFLRGGDLRIGNLVLSVKPHIFMSPPHILSYTAARWFDCSPCPIHAKQGERPSGAQGKP